MSAEQAARQTIDRLLAQAGWAVQNFKQADIHAARGVSIREFVLNVGHGFAQQKSPVVTHAAVVRPIATGDSIECPRGTDTVGMTSRITRDRTPPS